MRWLSSAEYSLVCGTFIKKKNISAPNNTCTHNFFTTSQIQYVYINAFRFAIFQLLKLSSFFYFFHLVRKLVRDLCWCLTAAGLNIQAYHAVQCIPCSSCIP